MARNEEEIKIAAQNDHAASVEAVMKKYDRESNTRVWEGIPKTVVSGILVLFSLWCIYVTLFIE